MKRFVTGCLRMGLWGGCLWLLVACEPRQGEPDNVPSDVIRWTLVTSWPKGLPGLGEGPEQFARLVGQMSNGRLQIRVYGADELVPAFEVFDAVSRGEVQMGHSAAYYWADTIPAAQFFSTVPFGMTAQEMNGWLHYGGGIELWREVYAPYGVIPLAGGNTDVQMGGWFKRTIDNEDDLVGLKMRLPGLGGEVLKRAGGVPVNLPGGELFTALKSGALDASEWVGPYNDLAFGLYKAASYYYYPGWQEPATTLEFLLNREAFEQLPADLQAIVTAAARVVNADMLDKYVVRNMDALDVLLNEHLVTLKRFPPSVLAKLRRLTAKVLQEQAGQDPLTQRVLDAYTQFFERVSRYSEVTSRSMLEQRE